MTHGSRPNKKTWSIIAEFQGWNAVAPFADYLLNYLFARDNTPKKIVEVSLNLPDYDYENLLWFWIVIWMNYAHICIEACLLRSIVLNIYFPKLSFQFLRFIILREKWWRHQIETFSALLPLCAGNSPVTGEIPSQRPVTLSCDVFFDLHLNKVLSKQSRGWWFETPWRSLWRHCNASDLSNQEYSPMQNAVLYYKRMIKNALVIGSWLSIDKNLMASIGSKTIIDFYWHFKFDQKTLHISRNLCCRGKSNTVSSWGQF